MEQWESEVLTCGWAKMRVKHPEKFHYGTLFTVAGEVIRVIGRDEFGVLRVERNYGGRTGDQGCLHYRKGAGVCIISHPVNPDGSFLPWPVTGLSPTVRSDIDTYLGG